MSTRSTVGGSSFGRQVLRHKVELAAPISRAAPLPTRYRPFPTSWIDCYTDTVDTADAFFTSASATHSSGGSSGKYIDLESHVWVDRSVVWSNRWYMGAGPTIRTYIDVNGTIGMEWKNSVGTWIDQPFDHAIGDALFPDEQWLTFGADMEQSGANVTIRLNYRIEPIGAWRIAQTIVTPGTMAANGWSGSLVSGGMTGFPVNHHSRLARQYLTDWYSWSGWGVLFQPDAWSAWNLWMYPGQKVHDGSIAYGATSDTDIVGCYMTSWGDYGFKAAGVEFAGEICQAIAVERTGAAGATVAP